MTRERPAVYNVLRGEASDVVRTPFGDVGSIFSGDGVEVVCVSKQASSSTPPGSSRRQSTCCSCCRASSGSISRIRTPRSRSGSVTL